jgi:LysM repeat protein
MSLYTVRSGDTLAKIAALFGTSVQAIAQTNYIQNVNAIRVGQVLSMPNDKSSSSSVAPYFQKIDRLIRAPADTKTSYPNL